MRQTRISSLLEVILNQLSGIVLSVIVWYALIQPVYDISTNFTESVSITLIYTFVSTVRSYAWRRLFTHKKGNL